MERGDNFNLRYIWFCYYDTFDICSPAFHHMLFSVSSHFLYLFQSVLWLLLRCERRLDREMCLIDMPDLTCHD